MYFYLLCTNGKKIDFQAVLPTSWKKWSEIHPRYVNRIYDVNIVSIFTLYYLSLNTMIAAKDCVLGLVFMFVSFAIMQNRVLAINGITYKDMLNIIKSKK